LRDSVAKSQAAAQQNICSQQFKYGQKSYVVAKYKIFFYPMPMIFFKWEIEEISAKAIKLT